MASCHCEPFASCHSEPSTLCHSEGAERSKNLAQDRLRVAISLRSGGVHPRLYQRLLYPY
ncbi:MAG: hypothetical protein GH152_02845 [Dehalococcoidia bacterium]|nr:hypothetical protein [Dehalococcoidia bacterium]